MLEGTAYKRWSSTPLCWLYNLAQAASPPRCPSLLDSGTAANPPARSRSFTISNVTTTMYRCVSESLTYLVGSSRFWSFMWSGMICVARGPEVNGWGSCPLNSDWMKCRCQLEMSKRNYQRAAQSQSHLTMHIFLTYETVKGCVGIFRTDLCGRRKLLGKRCHSFPTHTLTGLPSGTVWRVGSLAMRWNSGYRSRGAW